MDTVAVIILLIAGFLFGIISSISGIGGGVFFVSTMVLFFLIPINIAVDTSAFIILIYAFAFVAWSRHYMFISVKSHLKKEAE